MINVKILHSTSAVGTQILLTHDKQHVIVDIGDGTVRDLVSRRIDFGRIKAILLTHEHFDHFSGLYSFLHFCRLLRRKDELMLVAPKPVHVVSHLFEPPIMYETLPYEVRLVEISKNEPVSVGGLQICGFPVRHTLPNAMGYSIQDEEGYRVVLSGDTSSCPSLTQNVRGADLAVLEATFYDDSSDLALKYGHMTKSEARALGKKAKKTVFTHSSPSYYFKKFDCSLQSERQ